MKKGEAELPGLTDEEKPRMRGPKRASKIRKLFNLTKVGPGRDVGVCQAWGARPVWLGRDVGMCEACVQQVWDGGD